MTLEVKDSKKASFRNSKMNSIHTDDLKESLCFSSETCSEFKKQKVDLNVSSDPESDNSNLSATLSKKSKIGHSDSFIENLEESMTDLTKSDETRDKNLQSKTFNKENEGTTTVSDLNTKPKLRLNVLLASDPALKPDAKDIKVLCKETENNNLLDECTASPLQKTQLDKTKAASFLEPTQNTLTTDVRMKVYMCIPCGIGFSSPSTLEAHQTYYCSHRKAENNVTSSMPVVFDENTLSNLPENLLSNASTSTVSKESASKIIKPSKQYTCMQCCYSADKKVSLNRHMRMHQTSPIVPSSNIKSTICSGNEGLDDGPSQNLQQTDRYCSDCDIKFNNVKTYRAHKQHYCSSRKVDGLLIPKLENTTQNSLSTSVSNLRTATPQPAVSSLAIESTAATEISNPFSPQLFLALPTNPILIVPYSLVRGASLIPSPLTIALSGNANPNSTCFALESGQLKPLATALNVGDKNAHSAAESAASQSDDYHDQISLKHLITLSNESNESFTSTNNTVVNESINCLNKTASMNEGSFRNSSPLDLSFRRYSISNELPRQRLSVNSESVLPNSSLSEASIKSTPIGESDNISPEHIVCAPSLPNSPSISPSPKRRAILSPQSSSSRSAQSISPPVSGVMPRVFSANENENILENLNFCFPFFSANNAFKFSDTKVASLLSSQNLELALKLSASATTSVTARNHQSPPITTSSTSNEPNLVESISSNTIAVSSTADRSAANPTAQPQIYVKQGVSKCKECNIVFCKYENYLAHKLHYCSARNININEEENSTSNASKHSVNAAAVDAAQVAYQQLICAACGIKYTSLDNLRAHQKYYCPKGSETILNNNMSKKFVSEQILQKNSKTLASSIVPAVSNTSGLNLKPTIYKCHFCDTISLTPAENRKHMEIHGAIKAFCCSICHYKGNTFRGIRTHIRMHFDKNTASVNEEHYITCLFEDDGQEVPVAKPLNPEQQLHTESGLHQSVYSCESCSYSSTYKGDLARHMKFVHSQNEDDLRTHSPKSDDEDEHSFNKNTNNDKSLHTTIKVEQTDASLINLDMLNSHVLTSKNISDNDMSIGSMQDPGGVIEIKTEPIDISTDNLPTEPIALGSSNESQPSVLHRSSEESLAVQKKDSSSSHSHSQNYCQVCNISFKYVNTFLAHKQFYCKSSLQNCEKIENATPLNVETEQA